MGEWQLVIVTTELLRRLGPGAEMLDPNTESIWRLRADGIWREVRADGASGMPRWFKDMAGRTMWLIRDGS